MTRKYTRPMKSKYDDPEYLKQWNQEHPFRADMKENLLVATNNAAKDGYLINK